MPASGKGKIQSGKKPESKAIHGYALVTVHEEVEQGARDTGKTSSFLVGEAIRLGIKKAVKLHTPKVEQK